jgi:Acetyltransferase (GNAT) domain
MFPISLGGDSVKNTNTEMTGSFTIQHMTRDKIDIAKWNACIDAAHNGLIYADSFYLDHMATNWDALVLDDYEAVIPLTWNKKYGISYLYQPFLTAQLGLFGNNLSSELLEAFLNTIPSKFKYWDFYLNHGNVFALKNFSLYERTNYVLNLHRSYEEISNGYRENITRNIKKATQTGCRAAKDFDEEKVIELAIHQMNTYSKESKENVTRFRTLYKYLQQHGQATTYGIFSPKDELLASCVFFFSHNRAYYILVGNHPNGRTIGASHALIDAFIKDHAGKKMILDFEGSDIRNLAFFYSSYGATEENFAGIKMNRLPAYLRWIKK